MAQSFEEWSNKLGKQLHTPDFKPKTYRKKTEISHCHFISSNKKCQGFRSGVHQPFFFIVSNGPRGLWLFLTTTQGSHRGPVLLRHCNFVPTAVKSSQLERQSRFDHQSGKYDDMACSLYSAFWQPLVDTIRSLLFEVAKVMSREQIKYAVLLLFQSSTNVLQVHP